MRVFLFIISIFYVVSVPAQVADTYEKALQRYNENDIEEAYIYLKNALQQNPNHLPSKLLMGRTLFSKGFARDALIEFEESIAAGADENIIISDLARIHLYLGDEGAIFALSDIGLNTQNKFEISLIKATTAFNINDDELAEKYYKEALSILPDSKRALQSIAYFYLFTDRAEQAKIYISSLSEIDNNDQRTLHLQGQLAKRNNKDELALNYFQKAYELAPNDPLIQRTLANAYISVNDTENAKEVVEVIIKQTPDDPFALLLFGKLMETSSKVMDQEVFVKINQKLSLIPDEIKSERAELSFVMALATYMSGHYEQAVTELESYLIKNRRDINAIGILADTYMKLGQDFKALNLLDKNQPLIKDNLQLNLLLCNLYIDSPRSFKCELLLDEIQQIYGEKNPNLVFSRIQALLERGQNKEALSLFETLFSNQIDPVSMYTGVELYRVNGMLEESMKKVDALIQLNPNDHQALVIKAEIHITLAEYENALTILNDVLSKDGKHFLARKNKAIALLNIGEYNNAEVIFSQLINTNEKDSGLHTLLGQSLLAQDLHERALRALNRAKSLAPNDRYPSELLVQLHKRMGQEDKAIRELEALLREYFLYPPYIEEKAKLLIKINDFKSASEELKVLFGLWNKDAEKLLSLAPLQVKAQDLDSAIKSLITAEKITAYKVPVYIELIKVHLQRDEISKAKEISRRLEKQIPDSPVYMLLTGEIANAENDKKAAFKAYASAFSLDNSYVLSAIKLYQLAINGHQGEAVEKLLSDAIAAGSTPPVISNLLADYYVTQNKVEEALALYKKIDIDGYNNQSIVLNNIANLYLDSLRDFEQARSYINKALRVAPQSAEIIDTKGWILVNEGKFEEGLTFLRQAYTLLSDDPQIQYHLAFTLYKLDRITESQELIKSIMESPHFDFVADKVIELKALISTKEAA